MLRQLSVKISERYDVPINYCSLYVELLFSFLLRPTLCRTVATVAWPMSPFVVLLLVASRLEGGT